MAEPPIVVKKVIKKKGHGHHGGAWKLAYADFVTAMMAFFLLMWLLGSTDEATKKGISEYFQDPYEASRIDKGKVPTLDEIDPTELDKQAEKEDSFKLEMLRIKIEKMIKENEKLNNIKDQIQLTLTPEGLRIQIVDDKKMPMFKSGSADAESHIRQSLRALAPVINDLPNKITINGHTDSKPFPEFSKQYTNWELSSERANTARFELTEGGLAKDKILRVSGLADSVPYNEKDALDPMNRRISIIVMNRKTEKQLLEETGNNPAKDKTPPAEGGGHQAAPAPEADAEKPAKEPETDIGTADKGAPTPEEAETAPAAPLQGEETPKAELEKAPETKAEENKTEPPPEKH